MRASLVTPADAGVQSRFWIPAFAGLTTLVLASAFPAFGSALQDAEKAWQQRDQPGQTEAAIKAWQIALQENPVKGDIYIALTRACGRAYRSCADKEKKPWATRARNYGALAIKKNPSSPEAHARYAESLGQWAQANKGVGSLRVVKQAIAELNTAVLLDPHYAFAHMLLAQFYEQSPGVISVGDKKKALEHAKLAVEYGPGYAINHNTLAKIYLARGQKADAKLELEKTLVLTAPADAIPETQSDQDDAKELLKSL